MNLGDFFLPEDLYNEYKELCLDPNKISYNFDANTRIYYNDYKILSVKWDNTLYNIVINQTGKYIRSYFPKYFCSFLNAGIDGKLYLGIDDFGCLTGIPYDSSNPNSINSDFVNDNILESFLNIKDHSDSEGFDDCTSDYLKYIDVKIHKLHIDDDLIDDDLTPIFEEYQTKHYAYINDSNRYKNKKTTWVNEWTLVNGKLENLLNCDYGRTMLIEYISQECKNSKKNEFLATLCKKMFIQINKTTEDLDNIRLNDEYNLLYWLMNMRDCHINKLKRTKPRRKITRNYLDINTTFAKLSELVYQLKDKVDYCMIEIKINGEKYIKERGSHKSFYFRTNNGDNWLYRKRADTDNGPACMP